MATSVITLSQHEINSESPDCEYWARHTTPVLKSLMRSTGSYSDENIEAQVRLLSDYVIPNLGPRPSKAHTTSYLTQSGSPFQPNVNFSSDKPLFRYCWEVLGRSGGSETDPFAVDATHEILHSLSTSLGFSTKWTDTLQAQLAPSREEAKVVQAELPRWLQSFTGTDVEIPGFTRVPFCFVAFDTKESDVAVKAYFNPKSKEIATGTSSNQLALQALRKLEPALKTNTITIMEQFLTECNDASAVELIGVDCVDQADFIDARVKIYLHTMNNGFDTVREYMTMGGRLKDESTMKSLDILKGIWHLLLQQPEGLPSTDFNKPVNHGHMLCQKLYFSFEVTPGRVLPEVKLYVPTWNYVRSDDETIENYEELFRRCGQDFGNDGQYRKLFEGAFGSPIHDRPRPVHCDASFLYSEKKGVYQTIYFSPPLQAEL